MKQQDVLGFDVEQRPAWTGGKALAVLPRDACPECLGPLAEREFGEMALFRHGGYGATRSSVTAWCRCGWTVVRSITEANPRDDGEVTS